MKATLALLCAAMAGCSYPQPVLARQSAHITITEVPHLSSPGAVVWWADGRCQIFLRRYPACLLHEVRHCFEGHWHRGESSEDCK